MSVVDFQYRAGFYAENLLLYSQQAQKEGAIPLPIGRQHKFAPISLGVGDSKLRSDTRLAHCMQDVAQVAAHVLSGKGKHGFSDQHRGQLLVLTGKINSSTENNGLQFQGQCLRLVTSLLPLQVKLWDRKCILKTYLSEWVT